MTCLTYFEIMCGRFTSFLRLFYDEHVTAGYLCLRAQHGLGEGEEKGRLGEARKGKGTPARLLSNWRACTISSLFHIVS